jgi:hypothetical protein
LTDEPGEIIVVYTPGGGHKFYEEFGPIVRSGPPDPKVIGPFRPRRSADVARRSSWPR